MTWEPVETLHEDVPPKVQRFLREREKAFPFWKKYKPD